MRLGFRLLRSSGAQPLASGLAARQPGRADAVSLGSRLQARRCAYHWSRDHARWTSGEWQLGRAGLRGLCTTKPPTKDEKPAQQEPPKPPEKKGWFDKLKRHGPVFLVYWNGMWLLTGVAIFGIIEYKVLGDMDAITLARYIQLDRFIDLSRINPTGGNLALTIAINEALEVVRFPFVLATVPYVTRWWESVRPASWAPKPGDPDKPAKANFRDMVAEHGPTFVCWWAALWAFGCASIYGTLEYQLLGTDMDALALAEYLNLDQAGLDLHAIDPRFLNLAVAVAANEVLEFVRLPFAVATVTRVSRWWKARG